MTSNPPNLQTLIEEFLTARSSAKPSAHTTRAYRSDLVGVARRLPGAERRFLAEMSIEDLSKKNMRAAFASWASDHHKTSVLRARSVWNLFFDYLVTEDLIEGNPMGATPKPRRPKPAVKSLPGTDVVERLLTAAGTADPRTRRPWVERDLALVAVFLATGVRLAELTGLQVGSFDGPPDARLLTVVGKGDKARTIPVFPALEQLVGRYIESRAQRWPRQAAALTKPRTRLWVDVDGEPMTDRQVQYVIARLYERAGVLPPKGASVHALRHTFATNALQGGANVLEVQKLLGHASLATTQPYVEAAAAELRKPMAGHPAQRAVADVAQVHE